jgi:hypothetical protein
VEVEDTLPFNKRARAGGVIAGWQRRDLHGGSEFFEHRRDAALPLVLVDNDPDRLNGRLASLHLLAFLRRRKT